MEKLKKELRKLYEDIISKEKIELHLKNIDRQLINKEAEQKRAKMQVQIEERDLKRLEQKGLYGVFQSILGNKEERIEKERQEYLQAYLKQQSIVNSLVELKKEKELLLKNYSSKFNTEEAFDKLVQQKVKEITKDDPELGEGIVHFEERIIRHRSKIKEIQQTIREGRKTIRMLSRILINLGKIEHWGKGRSKRNATNRNRAKDRIKKDINIADNHLNKFEKELLDISDHYSMNYTQQLEATRGFLDALYDSLITDWVVKEKIENSSNVVRNFSDKILRIMSMLENEIDKTRNYIKEEKKDLRLLVMKTIKTK